MKLMSQQKNLSFSVEFASDLQKIKFDRDKIIQVLTNLVVNAIKFTKQGKIKIITKKQKNMILVAVQDTGTGIAKEDIPKIFQTFQQHPIPQEKKVKGRTGLGLAISKWIIDQHNGKIWVESEFGKGSKFCFSLPT